MAAASARSRSTTTREVRCFGSEPIDASGTLFDGTTLKGVSELQKWILDHPELFVSTVTEKLLTFGLGRGVEYYDGPAVRKIVRDAAADDYRFSSLIIGIVRS